MAGQGGKKARTCIRVRGIEFRTHWYEMSGAKWCRACGYQVRLHEQLLREDGDPRATMVAVEDAEPLRPRGDETP